MRWRRRQTAACCLAFRPVRAVHLWQEWRLAAARCRARRRPNAYVTTVARRWCSHRRRICRVVARFVSLARLVCTQSSPPKDTPPTNAARAASGGLNVERPLLRVIVLDGVYAHARSMFRHIRKELPAEHVPRHVALHPNTLSVYHRAQQSYARDSAATVVKSDDPAALESAPSRRLRFCWRSSARTKRRRRSFAPLWSTTRR